MSYGKTAAWAAAAAIVLLASGFASGESSPLWGELKPGAYAVGFHTEFQSDPSRPFKPKTDFEGKPVSGDRSRPLQISYWYPAESAGGASMTFADYVALTATEETGGEATAAQRDSALQGFLKSRWSRGAEEAKIKEVLDMRMTASRNAPPAKGRFPLVLVAHSIGMSYPYGNSVLCEYLASHGYVVASSPGVGTSGRQLDFENFGVMTQMQDLQHLIRALNKNPNVDPDRLAVIGFSFGALAGSLLAMHNTDVDAFVSLHGSQGDRFGYSLLFQNPLYEPVRMMIPVLHVASQAEGPYASTIFLKALKYSDVTTVKVRGSVTESSTLGAIAAHVPKFAGVDGGSPEITHRITVLFTQKFLDASVKKDPAARAFLENFSASAGIPDGFALPEVRKGFPRPPSEQEFIRIVHERGVASAAEIFRTVRGRDPEFNIFDSDNLNSVAEELIQSKKTKEAVALMKMNVEAYPSSWEVYDYLGRASMADGDNALAADSFRKSLELNPDNANAREMLQKLSL